MIERLSLFSLVYDGSSRWGLQKVIRSRGWSPHEWDSVHFSCSVVSDSLQPHELQHTRLPCPLPTPEVYPNSCPLSRWCHPTISSSVVPFSSCLQSFPASGSFQISQFFTLRVQNIGVSASPSIHESIYHLYVKSKKHKKLVNITKKKKTHRYKEPANGEKERERAI